MMNPQDHAIDSEEIETEAGDYTVYWYPEDGAEPPYNDGVGMAYNGKRAYAMDCKIDVQEGDYAAEVLGLIRTHGGAAGSYTGARISAAGLARYMRLVYPMIAILEVSDEYYTSEPSSDPSERICGMAWAPADAGWTQPQEAVANAVAEYRAWANGDSFGWELYDPSGELVPDAGCWGYYNFDRERDYTFSEAVKAAKADAQERIQAANLVGSGIVGLV